jgi:hypothetical protein
LSTCPPYRPIERTPPLPTCQRSARRAAPRRPAVTLPGVLLLPPLALVACMSSPPDRMHPGPSTAGSTGPGAGHAEEESYVAVGDTVTFSDSQPASEPACAPALRGGTR